jgi:hypothetical protein
MYMTCFFSPLSKPSITPAILSLDLGGIAITVTNVSQCNPGDQSSFTLLSVDPRSGTIYTSCVRGPSSRDSVFASIAAGVITKYQTMCVGQCTGVAVDSLSRRVFASSVNSTSGLKYVGENLGVHSMKVLTNGVVAPFPTGDACGGKTPSTLYGIDAGALTVQCSTGDIMSINLETGVSRVLVPRSHVKAPVYATYDAVSDAILVSDLSSGVLLYSRDGLVQLLQMSSCTSVRVAWHQLDHTPIASCMNSLEEVVLRSIYVTTSTPLRSSYDAECMSRVGPAFNPRTGELLLPCGLSHQTPVIQAFLEASIAPTPLANGCTDAETTFIAVESGGAIVISCPGMGVRRHAVDGLTTVLLAAPANPYLWPIQLGAALLISEVSPNELLVMQPRGLSMLLGSVITPLLSVEQCNYTIGVVLHPSGSLYVSDSDFGVLNIKLYH